MISFLVKVGVQANTHAFTGLLSANEVAVPVLLHKALRNLFNVDTLLARAHVIDCLLSSARCWRYSRVPVRTLL